MSKQEGYIGDYVYKPSSFPNLDEVIATFSESEFKSRSIRKRFHRINQVLLQLIMEAPKFSFLLPAVIEYIDRINQLHILQEKHHISLFEFWLNHFSQLSDQENYEIRSKIIGKFVPREDYQAIFPIGMNKVFSGTHFVAAHLSPDVDTMVASFWGWIDAFAARVGTGLHIWSLPGGPPDSPVTQTMKDLFGETIFSNAAHVIDTLTLTALDLVTQQGFSKKRGTSSLSSLDVGGTSEKAVIHVDEEGYYLGDWHNADIEPVRKIIIRFKSCLRWFENNLHVQLISLFANKKLRVEDIPPFLSRVFDVAMCDCEPAKEFNERQKRDLNDFLLKVLGLEKGLNSTFAELNQALTLLSVYELKQFQTEVESLKDSDLFDASGSLKEDRPTIFHHLEKILNQLDRAIHYVRDYAEQLDVAMHIKRKVLGNNPEVLTMRSHVEDMRIKMKNKEYLTVVIPEEGNKLFPVGIVWSSNLQKQALGTVSFRDFCNQEEIKMASYLMPISVIDHHKTALKTSFTPMALVADSQSCNVLVAEKSMSINVRYSLGGMAPELVEQEIKRLRKGASGQSSLRLLQRLLQRHVAVEQTQGGYFIHPDRELVEYLCFLHAILDDTDLLTKVSKRDIECVVELLNRIKSLILKCDVEVINLDNIPNDQNFVATAAKRILQNPEMYSVYRKVFEVREKEMENSLSSSEESQYASIFLDTKEQNGCCRVGQTKMFTSNFSTFQKHAPKLLEYWHKKAMSVNKESSEIDLHLHMISTVASASEVYEDSVGRYSHQDELWFWVPANQKAYDHLTSFLTAFQTAHKFGSTTSLEFLHPNMEEVKQIFSRNCTGIPIKKSSLEESVKLPIAILRFQAGLLNSRKSMVSPYLPKLIS